MNQIKQRSLAFCSTVFETVKPLYVLLRCALEIGACTKPGCNSNCISVVSIVLCNKGITFHHCRNLFLSQLVKLKPLYDGSANLVVSIKLVVSVCFCIIVNVLHSCYGQEYE